MADHEHDRTSFSARARWGIGVNVMLSLVALTAVVVMVNYLAARHYRRFYLSDTTQGRLTPETRRVLAAITNEVRLVVLFDRDHPLFGPVWGLLKEYRNECPRLSVEHVDYKRDLERAGILTARYQLPPTESDLILLESRGRPRLVRAKELSDYDLSGLASGMGNVKRVAFKGEMLITAALAGLLDPRSPRAYCLQGHGEHDLASTETKFGYSRFGQLLAHKSVETVPLRLAGEGEVPADCQLLIVAGPHRRLDAAEVAKIGRYLNRGGRLLALLSYFRADRTDTGLEKLLAAWGVAVGDNFTFDRRNSVAGNAMLCTNFSGHPVVKPLRDETLCLVLARSVDAARVAVASADAPRVEPLFSTGEDGVTTSELTESGVPRVNLARDRRGVIPLAVAVDKGSIPGAAADRTATRMIVVGESLFLANEAVEKGWANLEFANLAVNWLLDRPTQLAGIAPRPMREYTVMLSRAEVWRLAWLLLLAFPAAPLVAGLVVWLRRRR